MITNILLGFTILALFAIFLRLGSISIQLSNQHKVANAYNDDHCRQRHEAYQLHANYLNDLRENVAQLKSDVEDIKHVSDIFYKYKLPDRKEQAFLDEVARDTRV